MFIYLLKKRTCPYVSFQLYRIEMPNQLEKKIKINFMPVLEESLRRVKEVFALIVIILR